MRYFVRSSIAACAAAALFGGFFAVGVNGAASAKDNSAASKNDDVAEPTAECRCTCRVDIYSKKEKVRYDGMCRSLNGTDCELPVYGGKPEGENYSHTIMGRRERCLEIIRKAPRSERPTKKSPG